ncbi:MAG: ComF family protein [Candidatus Omnitrophota bacterium]|jgi:ComF family protein
MTGSVLGITKNLVNLIYPLHCASCLKALDPLNEDGVCSQCVESIRPNTRQYEIGDNFTKGYSASLYDGTMKELIHNFKFNGNIRLAGPLSSILANFIKRNPEIIKNIDAVTFVPLNGSRLREREFNQSAVLASHAFKASGIPVIDALDKTKPTKPQNELSRNERLVNLSGAFKVKRGAQINTKRVLLIDDVMTTGATLDECAGVLKSGGAIEVRCLTLARGV